METSNRLTSRPAIFTYGALVVVLAVFIGAQFVAPLMKPTQQFAKYNVDAAEVAIHGYDTVAYFIDDKPTKGQKEFEYVWEDARWQFASDTNRELFKANPERYAPQFGGYCAGGLAVGEYANGDPELYTIVDGKLYFIKNEHFLERWSQAPEAHIEFAEYNWGNFRDNLRDNM